MGDTEVAVCYRQPGSGKPTKPSTDSQEYPHGAGPDPHGILTTMTPAGGRTAQQGISNPGVSWRPLMRTS